MYVELGDDCVYSNFFFRINMWHGFFYHCCGMRILRVTSVIFTAHSSWKNNFLRDDTIVCLIGSNKVPRDFSPPTTLLLAHSHVLVKKFYLALFFCPVTSESKYQDATKYGLILWRKMQLEPVAFVAFLSVAKHAMTIIFANLFTLVEIMGFRS